MKYLSANFRRLSDHLPDLDWFPVADLICTEKFC